MDTNHNKCINVIITVGNDGQTKDFATISTKRSDKIADFIFHGFKQYKIQELPEAPIKRFRIMDISLDAFQFIVNAYREEEVSLNDDIIASVIYGTRKYRLLHLSTLCETYIRGLGEASDERYYWIIARLWNMLCREEVREWCEDIMKTPNGRNYTKERSRDVLKLCKKG